MKKPAAQEDAAAVVASREKELKSMDAPSLKNLVLSKHLNAGNKADNIAAVLDAEAKEREAVAKKLKDAQAIASKMKADFAAKGNAELKELCQTKGLKLGGTKDEKVERVFQHAKDSGDVERALAAMEKEKRAAELVAMDKAALFSMCNRMGVDALNKEMMIERIVAHEPLK